MRRASSLLTLTTAGLVGLGVLASPASAAYGDNFVQAEATVGRVVDERSNVVVVANSTDVVDNGNHAEASSYDCTGCRSVAVAFQVVLVSGSPRTVTPDNLATAATLRCTGCTAIAIAKQYLVYSHGARSIDGDAKEEVEQIAREVRRIATSGASYDVMSARLTPLFDRLVRVVQDGLRDRDGGRSSELSQDRES